jgi:hypothetical protein
MTGAPRNACSEVYDYISVWNKEKFIKLIKEMDESVTETTRVSFIDDELMFSPTYAQQLVQHFVCVLQLAW